MYRLCGYVINTTNYSLDALIFEGKFEGAAEENKRMVPISRSKSYLDNCSNFRIEEGRIKPKVYGELNTLPAFSTDTFPEKLVNNEISILEIFKVVEGGRLKTKGFSVWVAATETVLRLTYDDTVRLSYIFKPTNFKLRVCSKGGSYGYFGEAYENREKKSIVANEMTEHSEIKVTIAEIKDTGTDRKIRSNISSKRSGPGLAHIFDVVQSYNCIISEEVCQSTAEPLNNKNGNSIVEIGGLDKIGSAYLSVGQRGLADAYINFKKYYAAIVEGVGVPVYVYRRTKIIENGKNKVSELVVGSPVDYTERVMSELKEYDIQPVSSSGENINYIIGREYEYFKIDTSKLDAVNFDSKRMMSNEKIVKHIKQFRRAQAQISVIRDYLRMIERYCNENCIEYHEMQHMRLLEKLPDKVFEKACKELNEMGVDVRTGEIKTEARSRKPKFKGNRNEIMFLEYCLGNQNDIMGAPPTEKEKQEILKSEEYSKIKGWAMECLKSKDQALIKGRYANISDLLAVEKKSISILKYTMWVHTMMYMQYVYGEKAIENVGETQNERSKWLFVDTVRGVSLYKCTEKGCEELWLRASGIKIW